MRWVFAKTLEGTGGLGSGQAVIGMSTLLILAGRKGERAKTE